MNAVTVETLRRMKIRLVRTFPLGHFAVYVGRSCAYHGPNLAKAERIAADAVASALWEGDY